MFKTGPQHGCYSSTRLNLGYAIHKLRRCRNNGQTHSYRQPVKDSAERVLWHKLTVHERVYKRSGTDSCPICAHKESIKHAMVECSMFKAAAAVIQHYFGSVATGDGEFLVGDMMESDHQKWLLSMDKGWPMWSARSGHWRYRCEVKVGASPMFTSCLTTCLCELCEWIEYYSGERKDHWRGFKQSLEHLRDTEVQPRQGDVHINKGLMAIRAPRWRFACTGGGSRAPVAVHAPRWRFARPDGGSRALMAVRAPT